MRITPTVGRVMHFWPLPGDTLSGVNKGDQPFAALVAHVNDDGTVNLTVSDRDGNTHARQRVVLLQENDELPQEATCFAKWMPFQQGQAASQGSDIDGRVTELEQALPNGVARVGEMIGELEVRIEALENLTKGLRNTAGAVDASVGSGG